MSDRRLCKCGCGFFVSKPHVEYIRNHRPVLFWERVDKNGPLHPIHGRCWVWLGGSDRDGYGRIKIRGTSYKCSRYIWKVSIGAIPEGQCVLHKCDNRACVNIDHLYLGTNAINSLDMVSKHRQATGEKHGCVKLTEDEVKEIRIRYEKNSTTEGSEALGRLFGVSGVQILNIISGRHWKLTEGV